VRRLRFHGGWRAITGADRSEILRRDGMRLFFSGSLEMSTEMREWASNNFRDARVVARDAPLEWGVTLEQGFQYTVGATQLHAIAEVHVADSAPSEVTLEIFDGHVVPESVTLAPGPAKLKLVNRSEEPELLIFIGRFEEDDPAAATDEEPSGPPDGWMEWLPFLTGKRLLSTQSFRELFRTESLAPDAWLELQSLAILFTDLRASTQMYERIGDLEALRLVREHFKILRDVIASEDGAIVKTIGDAVMATFPETRQAVRAGALIHRALEGLATPADLALKVGVHAGPCVAIDSNERLDYFGQTVNVAARVQGLADGRELVCTDFVFQSPGVRDALGELSVELHREEVRLKGIDAKVVVHRGLVR
jgi:class 3 adenylate cyclase